MDSRVNEVAGFKSEAIFTATGTQMDLLASEIIPIKLNTYFGTQMSSVHRRGQYSPLAKCGSNNFFQKYD